MKRDHKKTRMKGLFSSSRCRHAAPRRTFLWVAVVMLISSAIIGGWTISPQFAGKIVGRVLDAATGEPLPGVNVGIVGTTSGASTDSEGDFIILNVSPGKHEVRISMIGYQTQTIVEVVVQTDVTTRIPDINLAEDVLKLGDEIVIVATVEMITMDMTATRATVSSEEIALLPVEEFEDVVVLQAGVTTGRDGELHIRGGRTEEIIYMVDGVTMSDVFSGGLNIEVENSSIQELQVISGTFNAEYGRALSGVVNIVTKEGGEKLSGSATIYGGDFASNADNLFHDISNVSISATRNFQLTLDGTVPGTRRKLRFFTTGRFFEDQGFIFGERIFNPGDISNFSADDSSQWVINATGDGEIIAMRPLEKTSFHGKLTYQLANSIKLKGSALLSSVETRDWSDEGAEFTPENLAHNFHRFRLNPDGATRQFRDSKTFILTLNHLLDLKTFYDLNLSVLENKVKSYTFEDPFDPRNQDRNFLQNVSDNAFFTGGTDPWHSNRKTTTWSAKFDITSQVTKKHLVKAGLEYRAHQIDFSEFKLIAATSDAGITLVPFQAALPPRESPFNNSYVKEPTEIALYIQDKVELDNVIINIGVRFDRFNPNAVVPTDFGDPANPDKFEDATPKSLFSPRLGMAFPITSQGVLHFSYGFFFQMPTFQFLYANSEFEVEIGRLKTLMGNADLDPQKTIVYELGLQQQLTRDLAFDFTIYYKDIRELLGTEIKELTIGLDRYARYINRDFGTVRGFIVSLNQRAAKWMRTSVDYTFQIAEGNASEPNAAFVDSKSNRESEKRMVPLDWDQRHTINASVSLFPSDRASITFLWKFGSGLPYTPSFLNIRTAFENTARSPATYSIDLKADYVLHFKSVRYSFFAMIFNLLDQRNEQIVYADTGRAGFTIQSQLSGRVRGVNTVDQFFNRSDFYSPPRQVRLGVTVGF